MTSRESAKLQMYLAVGAVCELPEHADAVSKIADFDAALRSFLSLPLPLDPNGHPAAADTLSEVLLEGDLCLERMDALSCELLSDFPEFVRAYDVARLIGHAAGRLESPLSPTLAASAKQGGKRANRGKAMGRHRLPKTAAAPAGIIATGGLDS